MGKGFFLSQQQYFIHRCKLCDIFFFVRNTVYECYLGKFVFDCDTIRASSFIIGISANTWEPNLSASLQTFGGLVDNFWQCM